MLSPLVWLSSLNQNHLLCKQNSGSIYIYLQAQLDLFGVYASLNMFGQEEKILWTCGTETIYLLFGPMLLKNKNNTTKIQIVHENKRKSHPIFMLTKNDVLYKKCTQLLNVTGIEGQIDDNE